MTPDAPVQDAVPDTAPADTLAADTTADAAVVPADAQNVVQDAKPEAAAAASTAAPAAAARPQTGANWLAVVGTALSGLFLLAAGCVLDRKNRRMNSSHPRLPCRSASSTAVRYPFITEPPRAR